MLLNDDKKLMPLNKSKIQIRREKRKLRKYLEQEQKAIWLLNKLNKRGKLEADKTEILKKRNAFRKVHKQKLKETQEAQRQHSIKRVLIRRKVQANKSIEPVMIKVDGKEVDIAPSIKIIREFLTDVFLGIADKRVELKDLPVTEKARQIIRKYSLKAKSVNKHYLERSHIIHVIEKHIKTKELTVREYEYIPQLLLSEDIKFEAGRKNGQSNKLVYKKIINGGGYTLIEAIPSEKKGNKRLMIVSFYRDYK